MNKKIKTVLYIAAFVLSIAIAVFAYNSLSQKVSPHNNIDVTQNDDETTKTGQDEETDKIKRLISRF